VWRKFTLLHWQFRATKIAFQARDTVPTEKVRETFSKQSLLVTESGISMDGAGLFLDED